MNRELKTRGPAQFMTDLTPASTYYEQNLDALYLEGQQILGDSDYLPINTN
ncbi:hypothetical protein Lepto7375DRAFT_3062 [Leptolyngbya sp. PCC 7375]|nr:hypothetical protein Lepto7375DRAFT_3062 [Leptolyngbya sp. PCC 7375]